MSFKPALIVVDMQNDFCPPDGSLAVTGARDTVPLINSLLASPKFVARVATQDYHPIKHISFASNHSAPNNKPFESFFEMKNHVGNKPEETMQQRLWPVHCVQGTRGAEVIDELDTSNVDTFVKKGMNERVEMYSAFSDSFGNMTAGAGGVSHDLAKHLKDRGVTDCYVVGIAGDYCVKYTALDAAKAGFSTYIIEEGQKCVDPGTWNDVKQELSKGGVQVVKADSQEVSKVLEK